VNTVVPYLVVEQAVDLAVPLKMILAGEGSRDYRHSKMGFLRLNALHCGVVGVEMGFVDNVKRGWRQGLGQLVADTGFYGARR